MSGRSNDRSLLLWLFVTVLIGLMPIPALGQTHGSPTRTNVMVLRPPLPDVTLSAMVQAADENVALLPGGTVDFFVGPDNYVGTAELQAGVATITVTLPDGSYYISAQYRGDGTFAWSYSVPSIPLEVRQ